MKACPKCVCFASADCKQCHHCGYEFIPPEVKAYRVTLTHGDRTTSGVLQARNVDDAVREAREITGFPEHATSQTHRIA